MLILLLQYVIVFLGVGTVFYLIKYEGDVIPKRGRAVIISFLLTLSAWIVMLGLYLHGVLQ